MSASIGQELFMEVVKRCDGQPIEELFNLAANLLVNAIVSTTSERKRAEDIVDQVAASMKASFEQRYDPATGKRYSLMQVSQLAQAPFLANENKLF